MNSLIITITVSALVLVLLLMLLCVCLYKIGYSRGYWNGRFEGLHACEEMVDI